MHKFEIEVPADVMGGHYSNFTVVVHSNSEFILDFAAMLPGSPKAKVKSRIIMTPENAKRLLYMLQENIAHYEKKNGTIKISNNRGPIIGGGFA